MRKEFFTWIPGEWKSYCTNDAGGPQAPTKASGDKATKKNWPLRRGRLHKLWAHMEIADILQTQKWAKKVLSVGTLNMFRIQQDWMFQQMPGRIF